MPPAAPTRFPGHEPAPRQPDELRLAECVREVVLRAVVEGFEEASLSGLCAEGAIEAAIGRARSLPLEALLTADHASRQPNTNP